MKSKNNGKDFCIFAHNPSHTLPQTDPESEIQYSPHEQKLPCDPAYPTMYTASNFSDSAHLTVCTDNSVCARNPQYPPPR